MSSLAGIDISDPAQKQALLEELFADPSMYPQILKTWVPNWSEQNIQLPVDQLVGFQQFSATSAPAILVQESTTSQSYVNLTTVGPTLANLPDGKYRVDWGGGARVAASTYRARMSISIDGAQPDSSLPQAYTLSTSQVGISAGTVVTLTGGGADGHTITAVYAVGNGAPSGATATFDQRYMNVQQVSQ